MRVAFALPLILALAGLLIGCGRSGAPSTPIDPPAAPATESVEPVADREAAFGCSISFSSASLPSSYRYALVTPSASILGNVASWSWNFGGGAFPNTSTLAMPMVKLTGLGGPYSGSLTVYDTCGFPRTRNFTYLVYPALFTNLAPTAPSPASLGPPMTQADMVTAGNTMVIVGRELDTANMRYARGTNQLASVGNWNTTHRVNPVGVQHHLGLRPSAVVVQDRIKMVYFDTNAGDIKLAQATTTNPVSSADWHIQSMGPTTATFQWFPTLAASVDGLVFTNRGDHRLLVYSTVGSASPLFPTNGAHWTNLNFPLQPDHTLEKLPGMVIANNRIYIGYGLGWGTGQTIYEARYASAPMSTVNPTWTTYTIPGSDAQTPQITVNAVGNPVMSYLSLGQPGYGRLDVAMASSTNPATWANWTAHTVLTGSATSLSVHQPRSMTYCGSRLCIAFGSYDWDAPRRAAGFQGSYGGLFPYVAMALVSTPTNSRNWTFIPVGNGADTSYQDVRITSFPQPSYPATDIPRLGVLYDQTFNNQYYAASYVPNPPPIQ